MLGDDIITVDGAGSKTISAGAGTDTLNINISGVNSLADLTISHTGVASYQNVQEHIGGSGIHFVLPESDETGAFTFTDASSNTVTASGFENITVNGTTYDEYIGDHGWSRDYNTDWGNSQIYL